MGAFVRHARHLAIAAAAVLLSLPSRASEPVPDFRLPNVNPNSPRGTNTVSPRDYIQQVSAYYFGDAT